MHKNGMHESIILCFSSFLQKEKRMLEPSAEIWYYNCITNGKYFVQGNINQINILLLVCSDYRQVLD
jgi:hypothetical protein